MLPLPDDVRQFVDAEVSSGNYGAAEDVVLDALRVFREIRSRHAELSQHIAPSIAQADRGEAQPLNVEELKQRVRARLREVGVGE